MKKNKSKIVVVADSSGSMSTIASEMENGFKKLIEEQRASLGECTVSLYRFSDRCECIYHNADVKMVDSLGLRPGGFTALFDAIGKAVDETGQSLRELPEAERPENVIVLIITDGEENASRYYTAAQVGQKIKHQSEAYNWKFMFLGANQDAILTAKVINIPAATSMTYTTTADGIQNTWTSASQGLTALRSNVAYSFSDADRQAAVKP